jgi:hypothetical protein
MCGLAGLIHLDDTRAGPEDEAAVQSMCDLMAYRGPDDSGVQGIEHRYVADAQIVEELHQRRIGCERAIVAQRAVCGRACARGLIGRGRWRRMHTAAAGHGCHEEN